LADPSARLLISSIAHLGGGGKRVVSGCVEGTGRHAKPGTLFSCFDLEGLGKILMCRTGAFVVVKPQPLVWLKFDEPPARTDGPAGRAPGDFAADLPVGVNGQTFGIGRRPLADEFTVRQNALDFVGWGVDIKCTLQHFHRALAVVTKCKGCQRVRLRGECPAVAAFVACRRLRGSRTMTLCFPATIRSCRFYFFSDKVQVCGRLTRASEGRGLAQLPQPVAASRGGCPLASRSICSMSSAGMGWAK